jgi:hypothetical protein
VPLWLPVLLPLPVLLWLPALLPVPALLPELPEDGDDGVVLCAATHAVQQSRMKLNRIDFVIVNTPVCWCWFNDDVDRRLGRNFSGRRLALLICSCVQVCVSPTCYFFSVFQSRLLSDEWAELG